MVMMGGAGGGSWGPWVALGGSWDPVGDGGWHWEGVWGSLSHSGGVLEPCG